MDPVQELSKQLQAVLQKDATARDEQVVEQILTAATEIWQLKRQGAAEEWERFVGGHAVSWLQTLLTRLDLPKAMDPEVVAGLMRDVIELFLDSSNAESPEIAECLNVVLDPKNTFYKAFGAMEEEQANSVGKEEDLMWRWTVGFADWVDAVYVEQATKLRRWKKAQIVEENAYGKIRLNYENMTEYYDVWVARDSPDIAPPNTKSKEELEWRFGLQTGDFVDAIDSLRVWFNATILDRRETTGFTVDGKKIPEVKVGFRVYRPDGEKTDSRGNFMGWSAQYDEWLPVTSNRIQPLNSMAQGKNSWTSASVDDSADPDYETIHAVLRADRLNNNTWLVDMINFFGNHNGFQIVQDRLASESKLPLAVLQPVCNVMANISPNLTRRAAEAVVNHMGDGMADSLLNCRENDLRVLSKERLDTILATIQTFVCRVRPKGAVNEQLTLLTLRMAIRFYKSPFMERKVQGLKFLLDTLKSTNRMANEFLNVPFMVNWLQQHNIVAVLFDGPPQLFEKTKELILFLAREKALTLEDVQVFWRAAEKEKGTEHEAHVYKVIAHVGYYLSVDHLSYIADRVEDTPLDQITEAMVTVLMKDMPHYCSRGIAPAARMLDLLWQMASDDFRGDAKIRAKAHATLCEVYKIYYVKPLRWEGIQKCWSLIKEHKHSYLAISVLHAIIESHYQSSQSSTSSAVANVEYMNRREIIMKLQADFDLLNMVVNELCTFLADRVATFAQLESETGAPLGDRERDGYTPADTHVSHEAQIKTRLDGIASLLTSAPLLLDFQITRQLWQALVVAASTKSERAAGFKFMLKLCETGCFSSEDNTVNKIFSELILSRPRLIWETADGFNCFKEYFYLVNVKEQKLQKRTTGKDKKTVEHVVLVSPSELIGEAQIWEVILHAPENDVAMAAIKLLNVINDNPSEELAKSQDLGRTRETFISRCMKTLDDISAPTDAEEKADDIAAKERSVVRSLDLIEQLLTQTELENHGGMLRPSKATLVLRPHMTRVKAKKVTIVFDNNIQGSPLPATFEGRFFANQTLWDVRQEVARLNKLLPEHVRLVRNGKEVGDAQNYSVLAELQVSRKEQWRCSKRSGPEAPQAELLDSSGHLLPRAREIFTDLFFKFAPDGLMTPQGAAAFIDSCVHDSCQPEDNRVKNFFTKYDHDKDGRLTVVNFLQLYQDSTKSMIGVVWQNLHAHGYRNDLKKENEGWDHVDQEDSSASVSLDELKPTPRYILTSNRAYFDSLLNLFSNMKWASNATKARLWGLLMRLPTSPYVLQEVQEMPDEDPYTGRVDWTKIFDVHNPFKLLYLLQVIYSILQPPEAKSGDDRETAQFRNNWLRRFVYRGGLKQLYDAVREHWGELLPTEGASATAFDIDTEVRFQCLALMLKCVKLYVLASLAIDTPELFVSVRLVRQGSATSEPMVHDDGRTAALPAAPIPNVDVAETSDQGSEDGSEGDKDASLEDLPTATEAIFGAEVAELQFVLDEAIAASIINMVDFPLLQVIVLDVAKQAGQITDLLAFDVPDRHALNDTVDAALSLWVGCILSRPHLLTVLIYSHRSAEGAEGAAAYMSLQDRFLPAMLCRSKSIRREVATAVRQVCINVVNAPVLPLSKDGEKQMSVPSPTALYLKLLLAAMPNEAEQGAKRRDYAQYFDLLCALIHDYLSLQDQGTIVAHADDGIAAVDVNALVDRMVERIQQHRAVETGPKDSADTLLMGAMKVLVTLLTWAPSRADDIGQLLMTHVFSTGLFAKPGAGDSPAGQLPVCKTDRSRTMAYTLLGVLCEESPNNVARVFTDCLMELSKRINPVKGWAYSPSLGERSSTGLVGLKNLGNTCYLNSTLQQLFMKPSIRDVVLALDTSPVSAEESIIAQLQHLFGSLSLSEKMDATTERLCKNIKDWDGNSINVLQQQDAQSFLLSFLDKLEDELANCGDRNLISQSLCGTMVNQLIHGEEMREREENFTCISLEVKNSRNIDEALEKFVAADTIAGFNWDDDHKNVDIQKRNVLGRLPNTLILHLNRFTMNLDTFMTEKLNTRFEFTQQIDMEPYTKEGVKRRAAAAATAAAAAADSSAGGEPAGGGPDGPVESHDQPPAESSANASSGAAAAADGAERQPELYELCGVVVHMGTADRGHYLSFVKDRERVAADGSPLWYEFNDSVVRLWDVANLEQECFGGPVQVKEVDEYGWQRYVKTDNIQNAYLLIYDKVQDVATPTPSMTSSASTAVPTGILKEVTDENNRFAFERNIFHKTFFNFVLRAVSSAATMAEQKSLSLDLVEEICNFTVDFAFQVLARADENHSLGGLLKEVTKMYVAFPTLAAQLLARESLVTDLVRVAMLECPDKVVRGEFSSFLVKVVELAAENGEREQYGATTEKDGVAVPTSPVERLFNSALEILREFGPKHWSKFHELLCFIRDLGTLSPAESTLALQKGWIASLCDFALQKHSPFHQEDQKRTEMGNKSYNPKFAALVECVVGLVKFSGLNAHAAHELLEKNDNQCLLSHDDVLCLDTLKLYELAFDDENTVAAGSDLMILWSRGSEVLARDISALLVRGIDLCGYTMIEQWLQPLRKWFALDDSFHAFRVWCTLGEDPLNATDDGLFARMWAQRYKFERWFFFVLQAIMEIAQHDAEVTAYLADVKVSVFVNPPPEQVAVDDLDEDIELKTEQKHFFDMLYQHYAGSYTSRSMPSGLDRAAAQVLLDKFRAFEQQHRAGATAQVVVEAADSGLQELFSEAKQGIIIRIRQDRASDNTADDSVETTDNEENTRLSLHVKNMRDEPVAVEVRLSLNAGAKANFQLPDAAVEVALNPTLEAEAWHAEKINAGAAWTSSSFSTDVNVEWSFKVTTPPDYVPTQLSEVNLRHTEAGKDVKMLYPDIEPVVGEVEGMIYHAMMMNEETSSMHAIDDDDEFSDTEA